MKYKGVIFDLDGTLIDTLADIARVANEVLESLGFPVHKPEDYKLMIGMGMRNLVTKALPRKAAQDAALIEDCSLKLISLYRANPTLLSRPYAGIQDVLTELEVLGVPMAVLSNKEDGLTNQVIQKILPDFSFRYIQGERKDIPKKPDPACAHIAAGHMGLEPHEIFLLGDSGSDMETAVNAGMGPVGALWGFRPKEELAAGGAAFFCESPFDILQFIKRG